MKMIKLAINCTAFFATSAESNTKRRQKKKTVKRPQRWCHTPLLQND